MLHRTKLHEIVILFLVVVLTKEQHTVAFVPSVVNFRCVLQVPSTKANHELEKRRGKIIQANNSLNEYDEKNPPLTSFLQKAMNTGLDNKAIRPNSLVVTKYDLPEFGIFADQTYELKSIYLQGLNNESGEIEKIELPQLDLTENELPSGYTLYIGLYSSMYHDNDNYLGKPVIVTPGEVGLVSMKDEVLDSILVAIPILSFWLGTCFVFATKYNERYGGNFIDALFGK